MFVFSLLTKTGFLNQLKRNGATAVHRLATLLQRWVPTHLAVLLTCENGHQNNSQHHSTPPDPSPLHPLIGERTVVAPQSIHVSITGGMVYGNFVIASRNYASQLLVVGGGGELVLSSLQTRVPSQILSIVGVLRSPTQSNSREDRLARTHARARTYVHARIHSKARKRKRKRMQLYSSMMIMRDDRRL